jgi:hypothetical protein
MPVFPPTTRQYDDAVFVRERPPRARQALIGAVRGAYADFLARDCHPALALPNAIRHSSM